MTRTRADRLTKRFGNVIAVDRLSLEVISGELLAIVGPTGFGKTTLPRLTAGLLEASGETISFDGQSVDRVLPNERRVAN